jgi:hypothetical protein
MPVRFSGAAHAGHDFVGDEKNSAVAANFRDALDITVGRSGCAEGGAYNRLENKCGDRNRVIGGEKGLEVVGAGDVAFGKCLVEWAVIAEAWRDVAPFLKEWLVRRAAGDVAAHGHGSERAAVIALASRDDTDFCGEQDSRWNWRASLITVSVASEPPEVK